MKIKKSIEQNIKLNPYLIGVEQEIVVDVNELDYVVDYLKCHPIFFKYVLDQIEVEEFLLAKNN